ncbi:MAG TPA: hypothetical protein PKC28_02170 [Bdellovibrionales bacterium]|nr:hypothetical protein [Bdellovibrionales bacterium]
MKGIRIILNGVAVSALIVATTACSIKAGSSGGGGSKPGPNPQSPAGTSAVNFADAVYQSDCVKQALGGYATLKLASADGGGDVTYEIKGYRNEACTEENGQIETLKGSMGIAHDAGDLKIVKFHIPLDANMAQDRYYVTRAAGESLWISERFTFTVEEQYEQIANFELKKTAERTPEQKPAALVLEPGDYRATDNPDMCDQNVGVGKNRETGAVVSVVVTLMGGCNPITVPLDCVDGVCTADRWKIKILSATSYEFTDGTNNATFSK